MLKHPALKLHILVVDDDENWANRVRLQSERLDESVLNIQIAATFDQGISAIQCSETIDAVVVDFQLDGGHTAFDFIRTAQESGFFGPFFIVSASTRQQVLGAPDSNNLEKFITSSAMDFFEKRERHFFANFEDRIKDKFDIFYAQVEHYIMRCQQRVHFSADQIDTLSCELKYLSTLIRSYTPRVKSQSFDNINKTVEARLADIDFWTNQLRNSSIEPDKIIPQQDKPEQSHANGISAPPNLENNLMAPEDYVPHGKYRRYIVNLIRRTVTKIHSGSINNEDIQSIVQHIVAQCHRHEFSNSADLIVLQLARSCAQAQRISLGVDLLYSLSRYYASNGEREHSTIIEAIVGGYLISVGRQDQGLEFLRNSTEVANSYGHIALSDTITRFTDSDYLNKNLNITAEK